MIKIAAKFIESYYMPGRIHNFAQYSREPLEILTIKSI